MLRAVLVVALLVTGLAPVFLVKPAASALAVDQAAISVSDDRIRATFSQADGQLVQVENLATGQKLVVSDAPRGVPLFAYDASDKKGKPIPAVVSSFDWGVDAGVTRLHWRLASPAREVWAAVVAHHGKLEIDVTVSPGEATIVYPAVSGISDWGPASRLSVYDHEYRWPCAYLARPASAPLGAGELDVSYYETGVGGFCTFNRAREWAPNRSVSLAYDLDRQCTSLYFVGTGSYGVTIAAMTRGDFVEGAAIYREWASEQPWCRAGTLRERLKRQGACPWLIQEVGCATFGISSVHDFSTPLRAIAEYAGAPVFHVMGFDWQPGEMVMTNGKNRRIYHGSMASYLPPAFHPENSKAIAKTGSHWAGFEFNSFYQMEAHGVTAARQHAAVKRDGKLLNFEDYWVMCSQDPWWIGFHRDRDTGVVQQSTCEANYYDIPLNPSCWSDAHGHAPGTFDAETIFQETRRSTTEARGRYVPRGTEGISEYQIDTLDFWQWRSGAWLYGDWDGLVARPGVLAGDCGFIPHFEAVYHEYGPIRLDGWANLADESGDLFYFTSAHTQLAGALLELNYEFQGMDLFPGMHPGEGVMLLYGTGEIVVDAPHQYPVSRDKAQFLGQLARLRTDWAADFLAFGRMVSNPRITAVPDHTYRFYAYNLHNDADELRGQYRAPGIVAYSWQLDDRFATLLANATDQDCVVKLDFDWPGARYHFDIVGDSPRDWGRHSGRTSMTLTCPSRKVLAVIADPGKRGRGKSRRH